MAEPGDRPSQATTLTVDPSAFDDAVGFASPSSLQGWPSEPAPPPLAAAPVEVQDEPPGARPPADNRLLWAYTVYALILFAVPTAGVSAVIGVLAVTGRAVGAEEPLKSHYIFQQRTLWTAAAAALVGGILIAIGLGVFILFLLAVWMIFRGAWGVFRLKAGRGIDNPRSWLV